MTGTSPVTPIDGFTWLRHVVRVALLLHAIVVVRLGLMSRGLRLPDMIITTIITDMCVREIL